MSKINLHNYEAFLIDYLDGNLKEDAVAELKAFVFANPQLQIDLNDLELPTFNDEVVNVDFKNELKRTNAFIDEEELINYLENNLPEAERKALELKLLENKVLALAIERYKRTILKPEEVVFNAKTALYKTEDQLTVNNTALAYFENQLTAADKLQFEKELKTSPLLQKEVGQLQKTKLLVDAAIIFPNKEALKKEATVIALFNFRTVASIAAAILLLIGLTFVFNFYSAKPRVGKELAKVKINKIFNNTENQIINSVDSSNTSNSNLPQNANLIAKKTNTGVKNNISKKDPLIDLIQPKTNSVAVNKVEVNSDLIINKDSNEPKTVIVKNNSNKDTGNVTIVNANLNQTKYSKQNYLIAIEEGDEEETIAATPAKKGFWQRAVKLAKQVNKFGVKAIDGEETPKNYSLSFNSFSVEKR